MTTVADVLSKAARACSVKSPSNWVTSATDTSAELRDLLSEAVDEILDRVDLPSPFTKDVVVTGTGVETYVLPSDYKRLTRDNDAVYETTTTRRTCIPVTSNGGWTYLKQMGSAGGNRYYRLSGDALNGGSISFYRPLETGATVTVSYVSKNWLSTTGVAGSTWDNVLADILLPERLVELGVIWRFRQRKGLVYADRLAEYEARLSRLINDGRGMKSFDMSGGGEARHPMRVPIPDYIPA